jgi:hypothetical protein
MALQKSAELPNLSVNETVRRVPPTAKNNVSGAIHFVRTFIARE